MDQYISAMGAEGRLLLIDCRSNECELVPFGSGASLAEFCMLVTNSNVKHKLSNSEYPLRVAQCKEAVRAIREAHPGVRALRDVTIEMLAGASGSMSATAFKRARHCVSEDRRTLDAVKFLKDGNFPAVGRCMTESHVSLRDDFEV